MTWIQWWGAYELGMVYSLVALGIYISFRVLQFPDLTVDGTFPLGAAVYASYVALWGGSPSVAMLFAVLAGAFFGWVTGWLSTHLRLPSLISGILTMVALFSINLRIMHGKPLYLFWGGYFIYSPSSQLMSQRVILSLCIFLVIILLIGFFKTQYGLALRATGSNPKMAESQGISVNRMTHLGLALSNALVALGGAFFAQINSFAEVNMGTGTLVAGLAGLIMGEAIFSSNKLWQGLLACLIGSIAYRCVIAMALGVGDIGLQASDVNLVTAVIVVIAMLIPNVKK